MATDKCDVLAVKVDNIEKQFGEFRDDVKDEIKEVKQVVKENEKLLNDAILSMNKNISVLTVLAEQQGQRSERQDTTLETIGKEVSYLRANVESNKNGKSDVTWHQKLLESNYKWLWIVFLIVLGFAFGIDVTKFFGILK